MKLIGFKFIKINAEKIGEMPGELKIETSLDILSILETNSDTIKTNEQLIEVIFDYGLSYEPSYAKINFSGKILLSVDYKLSREIIKEWKTKQIPVDFKVALFNLIIKKSSVKAFTLEEELNLPYHLPFPSIGKPKEAEKNKEN